MKSSHYNQKGPIESAKAHGEQCSSRKPTATVKKALLNLQRHTVPSGKVVSWLSVTNNSTREFRRVNEAGSVVSLLLFRPNILRLHTHARVQKGRDHSRIACMICGLQAHSFHSPS